MGYGLAIWLDNNAVRNGRHSNQDLLATFKAVVGTDSYPTGGIGARSAGPWKLGGAYHSTQLVALHADTAGIYEGPAVSDDRNWVAPLNSSIEQDAYRNMRRNPRAAAAIAGGADIFEALFGPNENLAAPASIWVMVADAITNLDRVNADTFAAEVLAGIDDRHRGSVRIGSHGSGLSRHGAIGRGDQVTFVWSGNRLCAPDELTEHEQGAYQRQRAN